MVEGFEGGVEGDMLGVWMVFRYREENDNFERVWLCYVRLVKGLGVSKMGVKCGWRYYGDEVDRWGLFLNSVGCI